MPGECQNFNLLPFQRRIYTMNPTQKYQRCMVMSGGGFRFGIYLGMYAAACECGRAPDLLLASCGSAIAANIISSLPDDAQRKAWLSSPEMYRFWGELKSVQHAGILSTLARAAKRKLSRRNAAQIPDLFGDYLFEVPPHFPQPPMPVGQPAVAVAIVGGKLLYREQEVGQPRGRRKLFAETLFCNSRSAALLTGMTSPLSDPRWGDHAVADTLLTDVDTPIHIAARISISDMFYFPCHPHGGEHYIGGVVDLFPLEVARRLAEEVMIEFKQSFDQMFSIPAWRAVLGLDGNQRLRYVNGQPVDIRVDTSDVTFALAQQSAQKKLDWRGNRIRLIMPESYETYVQYMDAQWQYGYARGLEACSQPAPRTESAMRRVDRYNKGL